MRNLRDRLYGVSRLYRKKQRGASVVEFAVIAPLFFMLILGIIEFGRVMTVQQVITNAAREGARMAILDGSSASEVESWVTEYLAGAHIEGAAIAIDPAQPSSAGYGAPITVSVSIPISEISWLPSPLFFKKSNTLSASAVMRRETVQ